MRAISYSEISVYQRCREEHRYAYVDGIRPAKSEWPLRFGKSIHEGLAAWWATLCLDVALAEFRRNANSEQLDLFDVVLGEVMLAGYAARWETEHGDHAIATVYVEKGFSLERHVDHPYRLVGYIDAAGRVGSSTFIVEHKTSSEDIEPGSDYFAKLTIDHQLSIYALAARTLGLESDRLMYDVLRTPGCDPLKATPVEKRKYKKTDGKMYANQREHDESPDAYRARVLELVAENPENYFTRATIVRLEHELDRAMLDIDQLAADLMRAEPGQPQPQNPASCKRYGSRCPYWNLCLGTETPDSDRFVKIRRSL